MPTIPESHRDLLTNATVALSTLNADGSIQTTAVWVVLDDDGALRMSLATNRQKYRNLVRDPHATVFALDPQNPFRFLEVRATTSIEPDTDKSFMRSVFEIEVDAPADSLLTTLQKQPWVAKAEKAQLNHYPGIRVLASDVAQAQHQLPHIVADSGVGLVRLELTMPSLEEIFVKLIEGEAAK